MGKWGAKGWTVYREGSRSGVLISTKEKKGGRRFFRQKGRKFLLLTLLDCRIIRKKWIAFIGLIDGKPYEIFTGLADDEDGILLPRFGHIGLDHQEPR